MKNYLLATIFVIVVLVANAYSVETKCAKKITRIPKGYVAYTNGTVVNIRNIHNDAEFAGPMGESHCGKICNFRHKN